MERNRKKRNTHVSVSLQQHIVDKNQTDKELRKKAAYTKTLCLFFFLLFSRERERRNRH
jgi:hypothetical protein